MSKVITDKCFVNGVLESFSTLDPTYKYQQEGRFSFTDLSKLNLCPYLFANETWDDTGLSDSDSSAHGTVGHFLIAEYLRLYFQGDLNEKLFAEEALQFAEACITRIATQARLPLASKFQLLKANKLYKLYVTRMFDMDKYLDKIRNFVHLFSDILYLIGKDFETLYTETGIYRDIDGKVVFVKADLIIEHKDKTYTIVDHKSSFNLMYFQDMQLPVSAMLLNLPVRNLVIHELSSGHSYFYSDVQEKALASFKFVKTGVKNSEGEPKVIPNHTCGNCTIDCVSAQTDKDGYISI